jgi:hypothetical protein
MIIYSHFDVLLRSDLDVQPTKGRFIKQKLKPSSTFKFDQILSIIGMDLVALPLKFDLDVQKSETGILNKSFSLPPTFCMAQF